MVVIRPSGEAKANEDFPQEGTPNHEFLWKHFDFRRSMDQDDIECKICGYWLRPIHAYAYEENIMREARKHMADKHSLSESLQSTLIRGFDNGKFHGIRTICSTVKNVVSYLMFGI